MRCARHTSAFGSVVGRGVSLHRRVGRRFPAELDGDPSRFACCETRIVGCEGRLCSPGVGESTTRWRARAGSQRGLEDRCSRWVALRMRVHMPRHVDDWRARTGVRLACEESLRAAHGAARAGSRKACMAMAARAARGHPGREKPVDIETRKRILAGFPDPFRARPPRLPGSPRSHSRLAAWIQSDHCDVQIDVRGSGEGSG